MNRNWTLLATAGLFEIGWVIGLKHAYDVWTWIATAIAIAASMKLLIAASAKLPVGTTYAVFTGIGTAGTVIAEMAFFDEPVHLPKLLLIALLAAGVIGLKRTTGEAQPDKG